MKITQYQLCSAATASDLTSEVNKYLSSGQPWQPYGQPFFTGEDNDAYCQAMVCAEEQEPTASPS